MNDKLAFGMTPSPSGVGRFIPTTPAPGLLGKGSRLGGMAPRQTHSRANTEVAMAPMAGGLEQKSVMPTLPPEPTTSLPTTTAKLSSALGNEVFMATQVGARPTRLQDMLKTAMATGQSRLNVSLEAARQQNGSTETVIKTASAANDSVNTEYALKLASAIEVIAEEFISKEALSEGVGPGQGHGALHVMQAESSEKIPDHKGQGHHIVPMHTPEQKATPAGPSTQLENNHDHRPGGSGTQTTAMSGGKGKVAAAAAVLRSSVKVAASLEQREGAGMAQAKAGIEKAEKAHEEEKKTASSFAAAARAMQVKVAEDAINPAHISAGAAVPPETSAAGESGGNPVGGAPQGPRGLVHSNESAMHYKKSQSHGPRREELKHYFNEPALSSATDKTLAIAFDATGQAGTKFASAGSNGSTKVAAARALIAQLAEEADGTKNKETVSNLGG